MAGLNKVLLYGVVGRDPEVGTTTGGLAVANFNLGLSGHTNVHGKWVNEITWYSVKAFGLLADIAKNHAKRGTRVFVEGSLTSESWTDRPTGLRRSNVVIIANHLVISPTLGTPAAQALNSTDPIEVING
jgi:single-strand DNA-binding protein